MGVESIDMPPKEQTYWEDYTVNTCYRLDAKYHSISYGKKSTYIEDFPEFSIISFKDFAKNI